MLKPVFPLFPILLGSDDLGVLSWSSKSPHDGCWPLQSLIIDLVLGKIAEMGSWAGIARKVQHGRDLHVPWNIGTNWNIDEEKFHNFIDAGEAREEEEGRSQTDLAY